MYSKPTPVFLLPVPAEISPVSIRRKHPPSPNITAAGTTEIPRHPWGQVQKCLDCGILKAGVGYFQTHSNQSLYVCVCQGRWRKEAGSSEATVGQAKSSTHWDMLLKVAKKDMGACRQWIIPTRRARPDSRTHHQRLSTFRNRPIPSLTVDHGETTRRVDHVLIHERRRKLRWRS